MGFQFYLSVEGTRQGKIKAQPTQKGKLGFNDSIEVHGLSFGVTTPTDTSTGVHGRRPHNLITVTKDSNTGSALLMQAAVNGEILNQAGWRPIGGGGSGSSGSGSGTGKPSVSSIVVTKVTDASSANFFQAFCTSELLKTVQISFSPSGLGNEVQWHTITLTNATIAKIRRMTVSGSAQPSEEIEFNYEHLEISHLPPK